MAVLAIDTSEACCSAALVSGRALASRVEPIGRGHAERLLPLIDELMAEAGLAFGDLDRIAVTTGPGTFTGLRIGLSVARGLALAESVPCIGLSVLEVLAAQARHNGPVHALVMGRGGQVYHQAFGGGDTGGLPQPLTDAGSFDTADLLAGALQRQGLLVGSGQPLLAGQLPAACFTDIVAVDPVVLGRLAAGLAPSAHPPEPTYLRAADAAKAKPLLPVAP
ncbi:MAG: tRNA (adenosine(37)-N6)-threonylcarbamoyltransferase complex dimerization subunit type 1 TsaB [Alphaproteobacteria bacterium]|nr:MAG: tRNA (adenosine(37)-N6)-threonylcarbamoyltransferase complex dimerization subunit type 1 TsaB [Alphaproteobacteria bacterium]